MNHFRHNGKVWTTKGTEWQREGRTDRYKRKLYPHLVLLTGKWIISMMHVHFSPHSGTKTSTSGFKILIKGYLLLLSIHVVSILKKKNHYAIRMNPVWSQNHYPWNHEMLQFWCMYAFNHLLSRDCRSHEIFNICPLVQTTLHNTRIGRTVMKH